MVDSEMAVSPSGWGKAAEAGRAAEGRAYVDADDDADILRDPIEGAADDEDEPIEEEEDERRPI